MGGYIMGDGWLLMGERWLSCYGSSPGSNSDISQRYKMGGKSKEEANTALNYLF
jgi:hypothetical protein